MIEYLIRRADGQWFDFGNYPDVLRPTRIPSKQIQGWGNHRIEIDGEEIAFSDEDSGWHVSFDTGMLTQQQADEVTPGWKPTQFAVFLRASQGRLWCRPPGSEPW